MDTDKTQIAYISDQQFPIAKADAEQVANTVSALRQRGLNIDLVIPKRWRSSATDAQRASEIAAFFNIKPNLSVKSLKHMPVTRLRPEKYGHAIVAPLFARIRKYDLVYTRNPLAAMSSNALSLPVIFETYRIYDGSVTGHLFARQMAKWLGIITHSHTSKSALIQLGVRADKICVIHNGFNPELFREKLSREQARRQVGIGLDDRIVMYSGRLDREKGIDTVLQMAAETPEINYLLIGKVQKDRQDWIERRSHQLKLRNIIKLDWMPSSALTTYLRAADVLLVPPSSAPMQKYGKTVLPLKLFIYLAAGRPILAPDQSDSNEILNAGNAMLVRADDMKAAISSLRNLFADECLSETLANQARCDALNYTWDKRAESVIKFLNDQIRKL